MYTERTNMALIQEVYLNMPGKARFNIAAEDDNLDPSDTDF